jgi:hypothetical protein
MMQTPHHAIAENSAMPKSHAGILAQHFGILAQMNLIFEEQN